MSASQDRTHVAFKPSFKTYVVLVRSLYDSNIGASSRAMANMGADNLILISPQCEITYSAQQAAATGQAALQAREVYSSWTAFYEKHRSGLRIAFSARDGRERQTEDFTLILQEQLQSNPLVLDSNPDSPLPVYLIFGPEDWGLSADDLKQVHLTASLPIYGENPSLNLSQAVLLALYILNSIWGGSPKDLKIRRNHYRSVNARTETVFPTEALQEFLLAMGLKHDDRGQSAFSVFQKLMLRTVPSEKEIKILEIIFRQAARKLKK